MINNIKLFWIENCIFLKPNDIDMWLILLIVILPVILLYVIFLSKLIPKMIKNLARVALSHICYIVYNKTYSVQQKKIELRDLKHYTYIYMKDFLLSTIVASIGVYGCISMIFNFILINKGGK